VKLIVDANIVFSAILNSNGKIGDILIKNKKKINFIAPNFLRVEMKKHHGRLCKISKLNENQLEEAAFQINKTINFISEEQVKKSAWLSADILTAGVDPNDTPYVAFSKHFRCKNEVVIKSSLKGLQKKASQILLQQMNCINGLN